MSSIKKFYKDADNNGSWKKFAETNKDSASIASGFVDSDKNPLSVRDVLSKHTEKIKKLERNVAWLALHGGGGNGGGSGGGGGNTYNAACTIKLNGVTSSNGEATVIVKTCDKIQIELDQMTTTTSIPWKTTVTINNIVVASFDLTYKSRSQSISYVAYSKYLNNYSGNVIIQSIYADDSNAIYGESTWSGQLVESSISINCNNTITLKRDEFLELFDENGNKKPESPIENKLDLSYICGIVDPNSSPENNNPNYILDIYVNGSLKRTQELFVTHHRSYIVYLRYCDLLDSNAIGSHDVKFQISTTDGSISNEKNIHILVLSDQLFIDCQTLSRASTTPTLVDSTSKRINMPFTLWHMTSNNNVSQSYTYTIKICPYTNNTTLLETSGTGTINVQNSTIIIANNAKIPVITNGVYQQYKIIINCKPTTGDSVQETYYFKFRESSYHFIKLSNDARSKIYFDYDCQKYNIGEQDEQKNFLIHQDKPNFFDEETDVKVFTKHKNNRCGLKTNTSGQNYYRTCNGSYAVIDTNTNKTSYAERDTLISEHSLNRSIRWNKSDNETFEGWTLSLAFCTDAYATDDKTVLSIGLVNDNGCSPNGITINAHDIVVCGSSVVKLTDETINYVDIVCKSETTTWIDNEGNEQTAYKYFIYVYLDAILSSVTRIDKPIISDADRYISIGAAVLNSKDEAVRQCDCSFYSLKMWGTALSDKDILGNYINTKIKSNIKNNTEDWNILKDELEKSFCDQVTQSDIDNNNLTENLEVDEIYSYIYKNNQYSIDFLVDSNGIKDKNDLAKKSVEKIGIPILYLNVNSWTFSSWSAIQSRKSTISPTEAYMEYWDPSASQNSNVATDKLITDKIQIDKVTVEIQGNSTLADAVKNLNITMPDDTIFTPKATWFPEQTYTLKADVVDSSHSNNAAIGKFINDNFGTEKTPFIPFSSIATNNANRSKEFQPEGTLKHTVEGFPVFLIIKFQSEGEDSITLTPVGIYSFNIGRNAYRNLGFEAIQEIKDQDTNTKISIDKYPFVRNRCNTITTKNNGSLWVEADTTRNCDISTITPGLQNIPSVNDDGMVKGFDVSNGDFWQCDPTVLNAHYEIRYSGNTNKDTFSEEDPFYEFMKQIIKLPLETPKKQNVEEFVTSDCIGSIPQFETLDKGNTYNRKIGQDLTTYNANDHLSKDTFLFNYESFIKYFDVCLMFGLVDNFGKNIAYKRYGSEDSTDHNFYAGFYDMDTALGGDNQGLLNIDPDLWYKYIDIDNHILNNNVETAERDPDKIGYIKETYNADPSMRTTNSTPSAYTNKIWLSLDTEFARRIQQYDASAYSTSWFDIRKKLYEIYSRKQIEGTDSTYQNIVDYFYNEYFEKQLSRCGALLFNFDYRLKYLLQFTKSDSIPNSTWIPKLHGRKLNYSKKWLKDHILFLDSMFGWSCHNQFDFNNVQSKFENDVGVNTTIVTHSRSRYIKVKTNRTLVLKSNVAANETYYISPKNTEILINAHPRQNANDPQDFTINNTPSIYHIDGLSGVEPVYLRYDQLNTHWNPWGLPILDSLELSGNDDLGGFNMEVFERGNISELTKIDFSNTYSFTRNETLSLDLDQDGSSKYLKLKDIDISSNQIDVKNLPYISELKIPDVPLNTLNIKNSKITSLVLKNQDYIENFTMDGCILLQTVEIDNCPCLMNDSTRPLRAPKKDGTTNNENSQLREFTIKNCENIKNIDLSDCTALQRVWIENCKSLQSIKICNCVSLQNIPLEVTILGCDNLEELDFQDSTALSKLTLSYIDIQHASNLKIFNIRNTQINTISNADNTDQFSTTDDENHKCLDLSHFTNGEFTFDVSSVPSIETILFKNIVDSVEESTPISLKLQKNSYNNKYHSPFYGCNNLYRIYGYFKIESNEIFKNLKYFRLTERTDQKSIWELYNVNSLTKSSVFKLQDNKWTTNIFFDSNIPDLSLTNFLYETDATLSDCYYSLFMFAQYLAERNSAKLPITDNTKKIKNAFYKVNGSTFFDYSDKDHPVCPSYKMFYGLDDITIIDNIFHESKSRILLPAPEKTTSNEILDNGIFSPLKNISELTNPFGIDHYITDQRSYNYGFCITTPDILRLSDSPNKQYYSNLSKLELPITLLTDEYNSRARMTIDFTKIDSHIVQVQDNNVDFTVWPYDYRWSALLFNNSNLCSKSGKVEHIFDSIGDSGSALTVNKSFNMITMDYTNFKIPRRISSISNSFNSYIIKKTGNLEISISDIFGTTDPNNKSLIYNLDNSFRVFGYNRGSYNANNNYCNEASMPIFKIKDGMFDAIPSLKTWSNCFTSMASLITSSYKKYGIERVLEITDDDPFKINGIKLFKNSKNTNLETLAYFFNGCYVKDVRTYVKDGNTYVVNRDIDDIDKDNVDQYEKYCDENGIEPIENVYLPGCLFKNSDPDDPKINPSALKNVNGLFAHFKCAKMVLTSNSFEDCINLQNVSSFLQYNSTYKGEIPNRLFYHGRSNQEITLPASNQRTGLNIVSEKEPTNLQTLRTKITDINNLWTKITNSINNYNNIPNDLSNYLKKSSSYDELNNPTGLPSNNITYYILVDDQYTEVSNITEFDPDKTYYVKKTILKNSVKLSDILDADLLKYLYLDDGNPYTNNNDETNPMRSGESSSFISWYNSKKNSSISDNNLTENVTSKISDLKNKFVDNGSTYFKNLINIINLTGDDLVKYNPLIRTITNMNSCFNVGSILSSYKNINNKYNTPSTELKEINEEYSPLTWIYNTSNGTFIKNLKYNPYKYDLSWSYTGNPYDNKDEYNKSYDGYFYNYKILEEASGSQEAKLELYLAHGGIQGGPFLQNLNQLTDRDSETYYGDPVDYIISDDYPVDISAYNISERDVRQDINYICSPDLFRYSTTNCTINNIFDAGGGLVGLSNGKLNMNPNNINGVHGRIPFYLFKPLTELVSVQGIFYGCRGILTHYKREKDYTHVEIINNDNGYCQLYLGANNEQQDAQKCYLPKDLFGNSNSVQFRSKVYNSDKTILFTFQKYLDDENKSIEVTLKEATLKEIPTTSTEKEYEYDVRDVTYVRVRRIDPDEDTPRIEISKYLDYKQKYKSELFPDLMFSYSPKLSIFYNTFGAIVFNENINAACNVFSNLQPSCRDLNVSACYHYAEFYRTKNRYISRAFGTSNTLWKISAAFAYEGFATNGYQLTDSNFAITKMVSDSASEDSKYGDNILIFQSNFTKLSSNIDRTKIIGVFQSRTGHRMEGDTLTAAQRESTLES